MSADPSEWPHDGAAVARQAAQRPKAHALRFNHEHPEVDDEGTRPKGEARARLGASNRAPLAHCRPSGWFALDHLEPQPMRSVFVHLINATQEEVRDCLCDLTNLRTT